LQSLFLKIDVTEIVVRKTDKPNTVVDLFDAHSLTRERGAEINFLFENADPPAVSDEDRSVVERIGELSHATIISGGRPIDLCWALHAQSFVRAFVVELFHKPKGTERISCTRA